MMTDAQILIKERPDKAILRLTLNREGSLNCLNLQLLNELLDAVNEAAMDKTIRALIIKGAGKGFCAGHDLKEITLHRQDKDGGKAYFETLFDSCTKLMLRLASLPIPVIAEVHKVAAAAGCQLVASADMAIADEDCIFAVNGIDAGLFCSTPQVALSRNIPRKAALEMLIVGERINAERALALGLLNRVVPVAELEETTMELALKAAKQSRAVVALGKQAFYNQIELTIKDAYSEMSHVIVDNLMMKDAECGIKAFIEKKTPVWPEDDQTNS